MNEQYDNMAKAPAAAGQGLVGYVGDAKVFNPTIRENIDSQIKSAIARVENLQETKKRLEKSGLLDVPIGDLRQAMNY